MQDEDLDLDWPKNRPGLGCIMHNRCDRANKPANATLKCLLWVQVESDEGEDVAMTPASHDAASGNGSAHEASGQLKFEVQVYRVRSQCYLLDVQRLEGHLYLFLDLCAALICRLHLLSPTADANGGKAVAIGTTSGRMGSGVVTQ